MKVHLIKDAALPCRGSVLKNTAKQGSPQTALSQWSGGTVYNENL